MAIPVNNKAIADFHVHTTFSDGIMTPGAILNAAYKKSKINILSFTDHYTTRAFDDAEAMQDWYNITVLPGAEISANDYKKLHILGLGMSDRKDMESVLSKFSNSKGTQFFRILASLKEMGVSFDGELIQKMLNSSQTNLEQIAHAIVKQGYAKGKKEARKKYISNINMTSGAIKLSAKEIIQMINQSGGVACIAHPSTVRHIESNQKLNGNEWEQFLQELTGYGLKGIESIPPSYSSRRSADFFNAQARNFNLLRTGGSDYHGDRNVNEKIGNQGVKQKDIDNLLSAINESNKAIQLKPGEMKTRIKQSELV